MCGTVYGGWEHQSYGLRHVASRYLETAHGSVTLQGVIGDMFYCYIHGAGVAGERAGERAFDGRPLVAVGLRVSPE
eukprot:COSAG02_NODE_3618_length_6465_cov_6.069431_2_plen_76_part_00